MNAKQIFNFLILITLTSTSLVFVGCSTKFVNLTPERISKNPSGKYTISMQPRNFNLAVNTVDYKPMIVIAEQEHQMRPSALGKGIFDYDLFMPPGYSEVPYYFLLKYKNEKNDSMRVIRDESLYRLKLANRYVVTLESQRGVVGAEIPILGRGFLESDEVKVGGFYADVKYYSSNSISFIVPALPAGGDYPVEIVNAYGGMFVSNFHIDASTFRVRPSPIAIVKGRSQVVVIGITYPAPEGGLSINVKTDIPNSIIMEEVIIPANENSVSVRIEGDEPGEGSLFIYAPGFDELKVPVSVL